MLTAGFTLSRNIQLRMILANLAVASMIRLDPQIKLPIFQRLLADKTLGGQRARLGIRRTETHTIQFLGLVFLALHSSLVVQQNGEGTTDQTNLLFLGGSVDHGLQGIFGDDGGHVCNSKVRCLDVIIISKILSNEKKNFVFPT